MHEDIKHWSQYVLFSNQYLKYGDSRIERVQELFQAINAPINTVFATQLAKWFANTKAVLTSMPPIVANIMSLERHKGITCFEQTLDDHLYLSSHSTKTQTVLNENDFSVPEARDWSLRLQALSKSWIQDTRDVREIDSALELMEDVDCCWSPYEAYLCYGRAEYGHSKLWHTRLFDALKLRPITWSGRTLKEVVSSIKGNQPQANLNGGGVPVTMFGSSMLGKSNAWAYVNAAQAINRTMRRTQSALPDMGVPDLDPSPLDPSPLAVMGDSVSSVQTTGNQGSFVIDSMCHLSSTKKSKSVTIQGDSHAFVSLEMTAKEIQQRMSCYMEEYVVKPKPTVSSVYTEKEDKDKNAKKFKHAPSVPGQNKDKPWLSGKRKNKL